MQTLIVLASRQDEAIDLSKAAAPLLRIYRTSPTPSRRMMAVAALRWVDNPQANQKLLEYGMQESDPNVRRAILYTLATSRSTPTIPLAASFNALRAHDAQLQTRARMAEQRQTDRDSSSAGPGSRR